MNWEVPPALHTPPHLFLVIVGIVHMLYYLSHVPNPLVFILFLR
jgi:hypothetical protein